MTAGGVGVGEDFAPSAGVVSDGVAGDTVSAGLDEPGCTSARGQNHHTRNATSAVSPTSQFLDFMVQEVLSLRPASQVANIHTARHSTPGTVRCDIDAPIHS